MKSKKYKSPKSATGQVADNTSTKQTADNSPHGVAAFIGKSYSSLFILSFFILSWLWASWWMGDVFRIAYERSFIAADSTLMFWLWQKSFGWLWIIGRALLIMYRWKIVGGLLVAVLLTLGSWLLGYCLRLPQRWRIVQFLPASLWMIWTAKEGLNLFYMHEPGRILVFPFLLLVVCAIWAGIIWSLKRRKPRFPDLTSDTTSPHTPLSPRKMRTLLQASAYVAVLLAFFAVPMVYLNHRNPYLRPLTKMQVQLLHEDYEGISRTAHENADLSYRQMAGYYALALARLGRLGDQLFDIKLDFDTLQTYGYHNQPTSSLNYHVIDCDYHAGLIRAARHYAVEALTMDGPSLFSIKYLIKISLIEGDWVLARKYLRILHKVPFESDFINRYEPMVGRADLVQADPEFSAIMASLPPYHTFEQMDPKPGFIGFYAGLRYFDNPDALIWSAMACLYSKRIDSFLMRCKRLKGTSLPRSIAEGLIVAAAKEPAILQEFPQLQMGAERYYLFLQAAQPYMYDRERGSKALFEQYRGYYPYYYFFGNIRSSQKPGEEDEGHHKAGVN